MVTVCLFVRTINVLPPQSVSVYRTNLAALDLSPDLLAHRLLCLSFIPFFLIGCVRQTRLICALVNVSAHVMRF